VPERREERVVGLGLVQSLKHVDEVALHLNHRLLGPSVVKLFTVVINEFLIS
jgi:hypothetical protein